MGKLTHPPVSWDGQGYIPSLTWKKLWSPRFNFKPKVPRKDERCYACAKMVRWMLSFSFFANRIPFEPTVLVSTSHELDAHVGMWVWKCSITPVIANLIGDKKPMDSGAPHIQTKEFASLCQVRHGAGCTLTAKLRQRLCTKKCAKSMQLYRLYPCFLPRLCTTSPVAATCWVLGWICVDWT